MTIDVSNRILSFSYTDTQIQRRKADFKATYYDYYKYINNTPQRQLATGEVNKIQCRLWLWNSTNRPDKYGVRGVKGKVVFMSLNCSSYTKNKKATVKKPTSLI